MRRPAPAAPPDRPASPHASVCVYCGSSPGTDPAFAAAAAETGRELAQAGFGLVYGGGDVGLMGTVARSALAAGGRVVGIIPDFLKRREIMLAEAHELVVVPDMHARKQLMFERADAFVALPGGIGTLEELVEQLTWSQLGRHAKPIVLVDTGGFWQPLLALFAHMRDSGFLRPGLDLTFLVARHPHEIVPLVRGALRAAASRGVDDAAITTRF